MTGMEFWDLLRAKSARTQLQYNSPKMSDAWRVKSFQFPEGTVRTPDYFSAGVVWALQRCRLAACRAVPCVNSALRLCPWAVYRACQLNSSVLRRPLNSRIGLTLGSAINLHQPSSPFLTRNFHVAAAPTTRAVARACREPISVRRTVARNSCRTHRNCRGAQRSAWCHRVAGGTGCRSFVIREWPVIGKAAAARTIVLVFRHPSSPGRRSSAVLENDPLDSLACGPADPLLI